MRVLAALIMAMWGGSAFATPVYIHFSGSLSFVNNTDIVEVGDYFYGTAVIDQDLGTDSYELHFGGIDITGSVFFENNQTDYDALISIFGESSPIGGFDAEEFILWLTAPTGSFLAAPYDLDLINGGRFTARWRDNPGTDQFVIGGTMESVSVPEPATLALLGGALLGFGVFRRRRTVAA